MRSTRLSTTVSDDMLGLSASGGRRKGRWAVAEGPARDRPGAGGQVGRSAGRHVGRCDRPMADTQVENWLRPSDSSMGGSLEVLMEQKNS